MSVPKITKADVKAEQSKSNRKSPIQRVNRQIMVEVEEGMTWSDLTPKQRSQVLFQHEHRWRKRANVEGGSKQAEHKLTRGS